MNRISSHNIKTQLIPLILLVAVTMSGWASASSGLPAVVAEQPPVIDGDLSDPCWQKASPVSDFYILSDGTTPSQPTTAWICYDHTHIYVAFYCKDSEPEKIVAQQKKRGGDFNTDDFACVILDCFSDYQKLVNFIVTAGGVQDERLQSGEASNIEWKGDWSGVAKRVSDGYTVEMAVPLSILQYDPKRTKMGVAFGRWNPRLNQLWFSPNAGPNQDPKKYYTWEGLDLPAQRARPHLLGYSLFGTGEDAARRLGMDAKHAFTPTLTGALTINPDFRNVEQDVDSVDFTYSERWLPEKRPFFLEGEDYFPFSRTFYSRRIGEIDFGAKTYGKLGNFNLAALHARRFGHEDYSVFQLGREWPGKASVFLNAVQSSIEGNENTVARASGAYRLYDRRDEKIQFAWHFANADAADGGGHGRDVGWQFRQWGRPRVLRWNFDYDECDSDYDPAIGYVGEKDRRGYSGSIELYDEQSKGKIAYWETHLGAGRWEHMDGSFFYNSLDFSAGWNLRNGTGAYFWAMSSQRPPNHDRQFGVNGWWGSRDLYRNGYAGFSFGKMAGGDYLSYRAGHGWRLGKKLSVQTGYQHSRIKPPSPEAYSAGQLIGTLAYDLDSERTLAGRLIASRGKQNVYLAYRQRVRYGFDAYIIFGDPNAESTRTSLTLKLVRPL